MWPSSKKHTTHSSVRPTCTIFRLKSSRINSNCTRTMVEQFQINRSNFKIKSETGKRPSKLVVNQTLNMRNVIHNKLKSLTLDSQQSKSGYNVFICKQQCIKTTNRQNQRQTDRNTEGSTYIAPRKQHPSVRRL